MYFSGKLISQLINRGYELRTLKKVAAMVSNLDRDSLLVYKIKTENFDKNCLFFKFPFDLNLNTIETSFNSAFNAISYSTQLKFHKFRLVYYMQNNLSSLFINEFKLLRFKKYRYIRCSNSFCEVCKYSNYEDSIVINDFCLPMLSDSNCQSTNVIYIITCKYCNHIYIGQCMNVKRRMKTHLRGCLLNIQSFSSCVCVVKHFNSHDHNTLFHFNFNIFRTNIDVKWKRLNLETQLINLFFRLGINLINKQIPNPYYWKSSENLFID